MQMFIYPSSFNGLGCLACSYSEFASEAMNGAPLAGGRPILGPLPTRENKMQIYINASNWIRIKD
jgi:hypothetical protein